MPEMPALPIAADLLAEVDGSLRLLASRERATGRFIFPPRPGDDDRFEPAVLPAEGRLWSWTVQRFRPKSPPYAGPEAFEPYAVGYVELDGALIVESRLAGADFDVLRIGMAMRLVPLPFPLANGELRTSFAFAPIEDMQP